MQIKLDKWDWNIRFNLNNQLHRNSCQRATIHNKKRQKNIREQSICWAIEQEFVWFCFFFHCFVWVFNKPNLNVLIALFFQKNTHSNNLQSKFLIFFLHIFINKCKSVWHVWHSNSRFHTHTHAHMISIFLARLLAFRSFCYISIFAQQQSNTRLIDRKQPCCWWWCVLLVCMQAKKREWERRRKKFSAYDQKQ